MSVDSLSLRNLLRSSIELLPGVSVEERCSPPEGAERLITPRFMKNRLEFGEPKLASVLRVFHENAVQEIVHALLDKGACTIYQIGVDYQENEQENTCEFCAWVEGNFTTLGSAEPPEFFNGLPIDKYDCGWHEIPEGARFAMVTFYGHPEWEDRIFWKEKATARGQVSMTGRLLTEGGSIEGNTVQFDPSDKGYILLAEEPHTRFLNGHRVNRVNKQITIEVGASPAAVPHHYELRYDGGREDGTLCQCTIDFHTATLWKGELTGITNEALLTILIDRFEQSQGSLQYSPDNDVVLQHLQSARLWIYKRALDRDSKGGQKAQITAT